MEKKIVQDDSHLIDFVLISHHHQFVFILIADIQSDQVMKLDRLDVSKR